MIGRDLVVDALRMIAVKNNVVIAANKFGKAKTVLQMIASTWPAAAIGIAIAIPVLMS